MSPTSNTFQQPVADQPTQTGMIIEFLLSLGCRVQLDSGEMVSAHVPKRTARGMFRIVPGDRVRVKSTNSAEYVVLGFEQRPE